MSKRNGLKCRLGNKAVMLSRHLIEAAPSVLSVQGSYEHGASLSLSQSNQDKLECFMMLYSDCLLSFRFWVKAR